MLYGEKGRAGRRRRGRGERRVSEGRARERRKTGNVRGWIAALGGILALALPAMTWAQKGACQRVSLAGEVKAGQEWRQEIGGGWVLRLVPIAPGQAGYTGWDLVVDRTRGAGYPDALLLATPPYASINEREIGTTYGLRAQDAMGWNPRSFHFLTDEKDFAEARRLFAQLTAGKQQAAGRLLELAGKAASGELEIEEARLTAGVGDAPAFAENWAMRSRRTPQQEVPAPGGKSSARGSLSWMRFKATLWLPVKLRPAGGLTVSRVACP